MPFVEFVIDGPLAGKGRPRWSPKNNVIHTPRKTEKAEEAIAWLGRAAMRFKKMTERPVRVTMRVHMPYPVKWSAKRRSETTYFVGRPDCDNQSKIVLDSLNKIVWNDDAQVAHLEVIRLYSEQPHTLVVVEELS